MATNMHHHLTPLPWKSPICMADVWQGHWITLTCLATTGLFQPLQRGLAFFSLSFKTLLGAGSLAVERAAAKLASLSTSLEHTQLLSKLEPPFAPKKNVHRLKAMSRKWTALRIHSGLTAGKFQFLEILRQIPLIFSYKKSRIISIFTSIQKTRFIHPLCHVLKTLHLIYLVI